MVFDDKTFFEVPALSLVTKERESDFSSTTFSDNFWQPPNKEVCLNITVSNSRKKGESGTTHSLEKSGTTHFWGQASNVSTEAIGQTIEGENALKVPTRVFAVSHFGHFGILCNDPGRFLV